VFEEVVPINKPKRIRNRLLAFGAGALFCASFGAAILIARVPVGVYHPWTPFWYWTWLFCAILGAGCLAALRECTKEDHRVRKSLAVFGVCALLFHVFSGRPHSTSPRNQCINNLRQIEGAKEQWALENRKTSGSRIDEDGVTAYLTPRKIPKCPAGGKYSLGKVDELARCSIEGHTM
jgi:hypothetical protein